LSGSAAAEQDGMSGPLCTACTCGCTGGRGCADFHRGLKLRLTAIILFQVPCRMFGLLMILLSCAVLVQRLVPSYFVGWQLVALHPAMSVTVVV
jgi:hypothetical protein